MPVLNVEGLSHKLVYLWELIYWRVKFYHLCKHVEEHINLVHTLRFAGIKKMTNVKVNFFLCSLSVDWLSLTEHESRELEAGPINKINECGN